MMDVRIAWFFPYTDVWELLQFAHLLAETKDFSLNMEKDVMTETIYQEMVAARHAQKNQIGSARILLAKSPHAQSVETT